VVYPHGIRRRFSNLGLERVFGSWGGFVEATQWQQYLALKYQIESMRRYPEINGYVITELSDVHWECNGLLDMHRNPKVYHAKMASVNNPTLIIPDWERVAYWQGEEVCVGMRVSHAEGQPLQGAQLHWRVHRPGQVEAGLGWFPVPDLQAGETVPVGIAHLWTPPVRQAGLWTLEMSLISAAGQEISSSHLELVFHPPLAGDLGTTVFTADPALAEPLLRLGCRLVSQPEQAHVLVCSRVDSGLLKHLQAGASLVVLASRSREPGIVIPGVILAEREDTPWDGDWASSFSWLERRGPYASLPGEPLIDHSFDRIIPDYVLTGWRDWEFPAMVQSGMVVGWVHKPAALLATRWYGQGQAVITSYRLDDYALAGDPTALRLLEAMLKQAACPREAQPV
jgi:hypothetical protein